MPPQKKRTLTQEDPKDKDTPRKRPRTYHDAPSVTKGKSHSDHPVKLSPQRRSTARNTASKAKDEEIAVFNPAGVLLKARSALSTKDLPTECRHGFRVAFRPAIKDFAGTLGPWEAPGEADIIRIWNKCFPKRKLGDSSNLQILVIKLGRDRISHYFAVGDFVAKWRWDIGTTAIRHLKMILKNYSDKQSARIAHATCLLGDDEKDRKRPFYYKNYGSGAQPSGIFQSPIIAMTLAAHLSSISSLPEESRIPNYPAGALALSILAVKRALAWAKSGIDHIPQTPEGHFSRVNWGDHYKLQDGQYVLEKTASNIVAVVNKLRDAQWDRILAEAEKYATKSPVTLKPEGEEGQSDFEVEDWDDDFD